MFDSSPHAPGPCAAALAVYLAVAAASALAYRRANGRDRSERPSSGRLGGLTPGVERSLRISTLAVGLAALVADAPWLLRTHASDVGLAVGTAVVAGGGLLFLVALRTLAESYSPCFDATVPPRLVEHGPYRFVRHPIYTANVLIVAGVAIGSGSLLVVANVVVLVVAYATCVPREEAILAGALPGYGDYRRRTGALVPRPFRR